MRVKEFETAILARGIKPIEVRLKNNHVKWFICKGRKVHKAEIIVYDKDGKALVLPRFDWPEEVSNIKVSNYRNIHGRVIGVTINYRPAFRDSRLDLKFEGQ